MKKPQYKNICFFLASACMFFGVSCQKPKQAGPTTLPLETFKYQIYDSVEGHTNSTHYAVNRIIEFQYDPNVDKCYMPQVNIQPAKTDTFDRHHFWERGYVNQNDFHHRIIFNDDKITIHYKIDNPMGESGFRYTSGVQLSR